MSKTKRRIKKLLKKALPLAALAGGAMMLGRRRGTAQGVSGADKSLFTSDAAYSGSDNMPKGIDKVITNVTNPNLGRMTGSGPNSGEVGQKIRRNYITRTRDAQNAAMMRALRSNEAYRGNMMTSPDSILQGVPEAALMAKDGGRIVKTKKGGKAVRGFGKAMKKANKSRKK